MKYKVVGGKILSGEIIPSGYKNSAVALIPASILFDKKVIFENVPDITDVGRLVNILDKLGSRIAWDRQKGIMEIDNKNIRFKDLDQEDLGNMRGTSLFWGPMLARFKKVNFKNLPGGCTLGIRPLDPHYRAFKDLGVKVKQGVADVVMDASRASSGTFWLSEMSPTATENVVMLASGLKGKTRIIGAASELQVQDLCNFLVSCGVKIEGIGSSILTVEGAKNLSPVRFRIMSDHHEITTFLALGAATGGEIKVKEALPGLFSPVASVFSKFGLEIKYEGTTAIIPSKQKIIINSDCGGRTLIVRAQPWPSLPVDSLPLFIPLALAADKGHVLFHNWMYESGLYWTTELTKLGADVIVCDPHRVMVMAGNKLRGATLESPFIIRAAVALVMAAMISEGNSLILNADILGRGHPNFVANLKKLGASIEEVE